MAEQETAADAVEITPITSKSTVYCERCKPAEVDAEWNFKIEGEKVQKMCDTHARWHAADQGMMTFPGDN